MATKQRPINGIEAEKSEDDIQREQLGPRGVPGAPDPAKMTPQRGPRDLSLARREHHQKFGLAHPEHDAADYLIGQLVPFVRGLLQGMHWAGVHEQPIGYAQLIKRASYRRKINHTWRWQEG